MICRHFFIDIYLWYMFKKFQGGIESYAEEFSEELRYVFHQDDSRQKADCPPSQEGGLEPGSNGPSARDFQSHDDLSLGDGRTGSNGDRDAASISSQHCLGRRTPKTCESARTYRPRQNLTLLVVNRKSEVRRTPNGWESQCEAIPSLFPFPVGVSNLPTCFIEGGRP
jgi:hypothetical protein